MVNDVLISPIDLHRDMSTCIVHRRDAYVTSFGSAEGLDVEMGHDNFKYIAWLTERAAELPEGNAHLWYRGEIIGQTEMSLLSKPEVGYVNLFYLTPAFRGQGLGRLLHEHACKVFSDRGKSCIRLSVSKTNAHALAFYRKHGWINVGERQDRDNLFVMEYPLVSE